MNPTVGTLIQQLRRRRLDLGMTQQRLARQLGVSASAVAHWEGGRKPGLQTETLVRWAQALDVDLVLQVRP